MVNSERTIEDFGGFGELTLAEQKFVTAACEGEACVLEDGERPEQPSGERNVRAELIRYLALGGGDNWRTQERGIDLWGANVIGKIDLVGCSGVHMLGLFNCLVAEGIYARASKVSGLYLNGSRLGEINAQSANFGGDVFLSDGFSIEGEVRLSNVKINGQLNCRGGRLNNSFGISLNAQDAQISGGVFLDGGFSSIGEVCLSNSDIGGALYCFESTFEGEDRVALNAQDAEIRGGFVFEEGLYLKT